MRRGTRGCCGRVPRGSRGMTVEDTTPNPAERRGGEDRDLLAAARAGDAASRERVLAAYRSLAERIADRVAGGPGSPLGDDARSVALIALNEAIDAYRPARGTGFRSFAARRVWSRLVDLLRGERRPVLSLDAPGGASPGEEPGESPLAVAAAWDAWLREREADAWAEEFRRFEAHLRAFGLTVEDLCEAAPRHRDTREALARAARRAAAHPEVVQRLWSSRQLPLRELERLSGLSRKVLERGRRYLVALLVILTDPELERMRSYVPGREGRAGERP